MRRNLRSVLTRSADGPDAVVRYGEHPEAVVDLHIPPGTRPSAPLLLLLHGGFWRQEYDRRHTRSMAVALRDEGFVVATPEYRRTGGGGGWPATFDDVAVVRRRLATLVAEVFGSRPGPPPPVLVGHSAGGQLALWWALTVAPDAVRRAVALAPVTDLVRAHAERLGDGAVTALLGGSPEQHPDRYAAVDPAVLLRGDGPRPPITVVHGSEDRQVPVAYSRGLTGVTYVELSDIEHFGLIDPLSAAWPAVISAVRGLPG